MKSSQTSSSAISARWRRWTLAGVAVALIFLGAVGRWTDRLQPASLESVAASTQVAAYSAMMRIGLVLGAIALAWDSLQRPARWLPPGLAAIGLGAIVIVAAQPRLLFAIAPLLGVLLMVGTVLKVFRRS